jgi:hypothetical protein
MNHVDRTVLLGSFALTELALEHVAGQAAEKKEPAAKETVFVAADQAVQRSRLASMADLGDPTRATLALREARPGATFLHTHT